MIDTKTLALAEKDYIVSERRYFHSHPELGNHEVNTTKHIMAELQKMGVDEILSWDDITGCVGIIHGKYPGKTVALRADIDASPFRKPTSQSPTPPGMPASCTPAATTVTPPCSLARRRS